MQCWLAQPQLVWMCFKIIAVKNIWKQVLQAGLIMGGIVTAESRVTNAGVFLRSQTTRLLWEEAHTQHSPQTVLPMGNSTARSPGTAQPGKLTSGSAGAWAAWPLACHWCSPPCLMVEHAQLAQERQPGEHGTMRLAWGACHHPADEDTSSAILCAAETSRTTQVCSTRQPVALPCNISGTN